MKKFLPYGRQWIDESDIYAVNEILPSDWITQGPKVQEFEQAVAEYCGASYAVAVSSGTAALHIAALAAGFSKGDEIITTPNTFVATANSIVYSGAKPVFADIQPDTYNINPAEVKKKINKNTTGIIPVDFSGHPAELVTLKKIASENNLIIIEDAAQALGSEYQNEHWEWIKTGSFSHADMTILSFHPVKHITTGEGGMVLTNNDSLYHKLRLLRNHGVTKDKQYFLKNDTDPWYYEMQVLGFNYRITDFQCALGISQLRKLDSFINRRREIADKYNKHFSEFEEIIIICEKPNVKSSYHLYVIQVLEEKLKVNKRKLFDHLRNKGLGINVHHIPVHLHPFYNEKYKYKEGDFPESEKYYRRAISLPIYPKMKDSEILYVINVLKDSINKYKI